MNAKGHEYSVELRIYGRTLDPKAVSMETGLEPCQVRIAGERIGSKTHLESMWAFNGGFSGRWNSLEEGLSFVIDQLGPVTTFSKYRDDCRMVWWCGHFQDSFDGGPTLSASLLDRMSKLGAAIFIDNYFNWIRQELAMENYFSVETPEQLHRITEAVHDCWFELEAVRMIDNDTLEIPFRCTDGHFFSSARAASESAATILRIHGVESFEVRDTEKVGSYDCNEVQFDPNRGQVTITTGIPLDFRVQVSRLRMTVTQAR